MHPPTALHLTSRARAVFTRAADEARALGHQYIGTEYLLLALMTDTTGVALDVLRNMGVDFAALRALVLTVVHPGKAAVHGSEPLPLTSKCQSAIRLGEMEATRFGHSYIGTQHLLLGLLAEGMGIGGQVLISTGVTLDAARNEIKRTLG